MYIFCQLLDFPLQQPAEEIEAVAITLQLPDPTSGTIIPAEFFCKKQTIVPGDTLNSSTSTALFFESDDLVHVQPILVIHRLEVMVKACPEEPYIQIFECGEDARKEFL